MVYKIEDALATEYADFLKYCETSGKVFISDLSNLDFVAFRSLTGTSRDKIAEIRRALDSYDGVAAGTPINDLAANSEEQMDASNGHLVSSISEQAIEDVEDTLVKIEPNALKDDEAGKKAESFTPSTPASTKQVSRLIDAIIDDTITLGDYFQVDPKVFEQISIDDLNFSPRPYKRLRWVGVENVGALLDLQIN